MDLEFEEETGENYTASTKTIQVIVHNSSSQPKSINIDGKKVNSDWNSTFKTLSIPMKWNTERES